MAPPPFSLAALAAGWVRVGSRGACAAVAALLAWVFVFVRPWAGCSLVAVAVRRLPVVGWLSRWVWCSRAARGRKTPLPGWPALGALAFCSLRSLCSLQCKVQLSAAAKPLGLAPGWEAPFCSSQTAEAAVQHESSHIGLVRAQRVSPSPMTTENWDLGAFISRCDDLDDEERKLCYDALSREGFSAANKRRAFFALNEADLKNLGVTRLSTRKVLILAIAGVFRSAVDTHAVFLVPVRFLPSCVL